jgi:hypothetical protein
LLQELLTTPASLAWIVILVAVFTFALSLVWRANRRAMRNVRLRIKELEKLRQSVVSDEPTCV